MSGSPDRIILVEPDDESRGVLARRLEAQGYAVEPTGDAAAGADMALAAPPTVLIADLWMPSISGVQLCRLLRAEAATADVPVVLRGERDDPRSHFWAERAGAAAYVAKGRMGELVRALSRAVASRPAGDGFFMQLSEGSVDIRDRIARHLDAALFDSVIAAEVRALANSGSFDRLFDLFSQFLSQVLGYRWVALCTAAPERFAIHHHPGHGAAAEREARAALGLPAATPVTRVEDADARDEPEGPAAFVRAVPFGSEQVARVALGPSATGESNAAELMSLVARELGGPVRMAVLVEESQRLASFDPLTGIMNRRAFLAAMTIEVNRSQRYHEVLSVLLFDVDHFKSVNDQRGHAAGDAVLTSIGRLLRETLRLPDLTARWGGEEFVVALPCTDGRGAATAAERLRRAIEALTIVDPSGKSLSVTVSIGVANALPGEGVDHLVDRADRAMYEAKTTGRNRVVSASEAADGAAPAAAIATPAGG